MALTAFKPAPIFKGGELAATQVTKYSEWAGDSPWLSDWRTRANQVFAGVAAPVRNDEIWRRVDLNRFRLHDALQSTSERPAQPDMNGGWSVHAGADKAPGLSHALHKQ